MDSENRYLPYYFPRFRAQPEWHRILSALFRDESATAFGNNNCQQNWFTGQSPRLEQTPLGVSDGSLYRHGYSRNSRDSASTSVAPKQDGGLRMYQIRRRNDNADVLFHPASSNRAHTRALICVTGELSNIQQPHNAIEVPERNSARQLAPFYCVFCFSNGETPEFYKTHLLKDSNDQVTCPILQKYKCPLCKATGTSAHTLKYCPNNPNPYPRNKPIRLNATGKKVVSYK